MKGITLMFRVFYSLFGHDTYFETCQMLSLCMKKYDFIITCSGTSDIVTSMNEFLLEYSSTIFAVIFEILIQPETIFTSPTLTFDNLGPYMFGATAHYQGE